jgi:hypothetical protein
MHLLCLGRREKPRRFGLCGESHIIVQCLFCGIYQLERNRKKKSININRLFNLALEPPYFRQLQYFQFSHLFEAELKACYLAELHCICYV